MNVDTLRSKLQAYEIPAESYSLEGGLPNEAYCIEHTEDQWQVYYSERGQKSHIQQFETENEACKTLFQLLVDEGKS